MFNITPKNLELAEEQMPENLYATFNSAEIVQIFNYMSEKHQVDFNHLYDCVFCVFLAILPLRFLEQQVQQLCQVSPEKTQEIVADIRRLVFESVAQDLAAIQETAEKNYQMYKQ